jgi:hypothetical protein
VCAASACLAEPIITIRPAIGPNDSSASFAAFVSNTISGLQTCIDPSTCNLGGSLSTNPSAFNQSSFFSYWDMARTSYSSWRGTAPAPGGAFAGEFGNLAFWSVSIVDSTGTFSLHDLTVTQSSTDASNYFGFSDNYSADNYGFDRIGINFGADGVLGGGDDTIYSGGESGDLPINALFFVGIGFGFDGTLDILGNPWPGPTNQDRLDQLKAQASTILGTDIISTCYAIGNVSSCTDVSLSASQGDPAPIPEPGSMIALGLGLAALYQARRRPRN